MSNAAIDDDTRLGYLQIKSITKVSHPFVVRAQSEVFAFRSLEQLGWRIVEVEDDGNCIFYAILLGLENLADQRFPCYPISGDTQYDSNLPAWQQQVMKLRKKLYDHSSWLLTSLFPKGQRNFTEEMWVIIGGYEDIMLDGGVSVVDGITKQEKGLSAQFLEEGCPSSFYFNNRFRYDDDRQADPFWTSYVLSSLMKMRIVLYLHCKTNDEVFSITTFEHNFPWHTTSQPHIKITQIMNITTVDQLKQHRISDEEYKRVPTIELLYLYFEKEGVSSMKFLRREDVPNTLSPTVISSVSSN